MSVPTAPIYDPATGEAVENMIVLEGGEDIMPPTAKAVVAAPDIPQRNNIVVLALSRLSADQASSGLRRVDTSASMSSALSVTTTEDVARREKQVQVLQILDRVKGCNLGRVKKSKNEVQSLLSTEVPLPGLQKEPNDPVSHRRL